MITKAARRFSIPAVALLTLYSAQNLKAEQHPLDSVPSHFIETGYFAAHPQGAYSPAIEMVRDELVAPVATVAATGFAIGFVHRFLADRLHSTWINTLGWPLLNMTYHFFMRPGLDRYTALRLLPDVGDAAMTAARGDKWAGAATPWLRAANTVFAGLEAIWPELQSEISTYRQCKVQPVVIKEDQSPASLSIMTCHGMSSASPQKPALIIDFPESGRAATDSPLINSLNRLSEVCNSRSISKLMLIYDSLTDGQTQVRVSPKIGSGWQRPRIIGINNLHGGGWWSDLDFTTTPDSQLVMPPLSPSLVRGIESAVKHPHQVNNCDLESERVKNAAGLFQLSVGSDAFWFRAKPRSLLPGGYQPLPEVVFSTNTTRQDSFSQVEKFRKHSLIPETMRLPWRITQIGLTSFIRSQSIKAAEKVARFIEEPIVLPGTLYGRGYIPDHVVSNDIQTYNLQLAELGMPEKVSITTNDGKRLQGLLIHSDSPHKTSERTLHIHYHGNGETSHLAGRSLFDSLRPDNQTLARFCNQQGVDLLIPEYRGYRNNLEPVDGQTLLDDANLFYRLLKDDYQRVTVSGWSLGSGMAELTI